MKLSDDFLTWDIDNEQYIIATSNSEFEGMLQSNETAAFIVDCLKSDTSRQEIISKILEVYDAKESLVSEDVDSILMFLDSIGAITWN